MSQMRLLNIWELNMIDSVLTGAKYLIIILFAIFTYISFMAQRNVPEENKKGTFIFQTILVLFVHFLGWMSIIVNILRGNTSASGISAGIILYAAQLLYLVFIAVILPKIVNISRGLNNVMCMLLVLGFIFQTRLSFATGIRHFVYVLCATIVFIAALIICRKVKILYKMTWVYCMLGLALLLVVFIFAQVSRGAKVSIDFGSISIQPFEFVKILFVMFVAAAFNKANTFKTVLITAVTGAVYVIILVLCSELGTALILAIVYVLMLFVATKKFVYLIISAGAFAAACVAAYILFSHVRVRVDVWLNPWADIDNKGYQITQSLFAIGSGGWLGTGLYNGSPEYVPMISNDFIFSAVAEELGVIFSIFLILLCLCFMLMIYRIAIRVSRPFYKLLAFGLGSVYGFQVFLTIGGAVKFIPSTGINLPFISRGGSSVLASMVIVAMVQALFIISEADALEERNAISEGIYREGSQHAFFVPLDDDDEPDSIILGDTRRLGDSFYKKGKVTQIPQEDIDIY